MPLSTYGSISADVAGHMTKQLLKAGRPQLVLEQFGQMKTLPKNETQTLVFRRYGALVNTPAALTEGVAPASQNLTAANITVTLVQYGSWVEISDIAYDTKEDPVLNEAMELLGFQQAEVIENMRFGVIVAGTGVVFSNGASRAAVNTQFTRGTLQRTSRQLRRQNARPITKVLDSTQEFNTVSVEPAFVAVGHTDFLPALRATAGWSSMADYGSKRVFDGEVGKVDDIRFCLSSLYTPFTNAGGTKGTMIGAGANADVYPLVVMGQDAWAGVALKGQFATKIMVTLPGQPDKADPLGQKGTAGWKSLQRALILNDNFLCRVETGLVDVIA